MAVRPGQAGTAHVATLTGPVGPGDVLVDRLAVGICGTDVEIADGHYGIAPADDTILVIGHESVGRVAEAPPGSGLSPGDLVVGIVRRPDPVPCTACAAGAWDMCRNGLFTERGIDALHGYGAEQWWVEEPFALPVPDALGDIAVLVEPASVVAKAWDHIDHMLGRAPIGARRALITGAGPIGLLAALLAVQRELEVHVLDRVVDGPKPDLVTDLGAVYHTTSVADIPSADVIVECTGAPAVVVDAIKATTHSGVTCLTGVSSGGRTIDLDVGAANRRIVLENDVIFGSVNANRAHYEGAVAALSAADPTWLRRIITRRVPLGSWTDGLLRHADDVKVIVELQRP